MVSAVNFGQIHWTMVGNSIATSSHAQRNGLLHPVMFEIGIPVLSAMFFRCCTISYRRSSVDAVFQKSVGVRCVTLCTATSIPQMYEELFLNNRFNPNGCPISMTMFVSHNFTKYDLVRDLYSKGMEVAYGFSNIITGTSHKPGNFLFGHGLTLQSSCQP
jgi:hypothetical protein